MRYLIMSFAFFGLTVAPGLAQVPVSPQESRERAPNMPALQDTVPERVRPTDPDSTGSVRTRQPEKEAPAKEGAKKSG